MHISLTPSDPRPIYVQIIDEIRRALAIGTLLPGDALPSARQLAHELRINPNTVNQAYRELERSGVVMVRRGQGTFACELTITAAQRRIAAREVASRALRDAELHSLSVDELVHAIRDAASPKKHRAS